MLTAILKKINLLVYYMQIKILSPHVNITKHLNMLGDVRSYKHEIVLKLV